MSTPQGDVRPPRRHDETVRPATVLLGVGLVALLHVVVLGGLGLLGAAFEATGTGDASLLALFPALFVGATQVLYLLPAWLIARRRGRRGIALGLVIGASLTFLGNSACFGALFVGGLGAF